MLNLFFFILLTGSSFVTYGDQCYSFYRNSKVNSTLDPACTTLSQAECNKLGDAESKLNTPCTWGTKNNSGNWDGTDKSGCSSMLPNDRNVYKIQKDSCSTAKNENDCKIKTFAMIVQKRIHPNCEWRAPACWWNGEKGSPTADCQPVKDKTTCLNLMTKKTDGSEVKGCYWDGP